MCHRKVCAPLVLMLALIAGTVLAQQPQQDEHHPPAPPAAAGPGMPGGMSGDGDMPMMRMMRMMMGRDGMAMMGAMGRHVEGRLAFLKTELKITDAQLPLWSAVADAMRANAKTMGDMAGGRLTGGHAAGQAGDAGKDDDRASRGAAQIQSRGRPALRGAQRRTEENRRRAADRSDGDDVANAEGVIMSEMQSLAGPRPG